MKLSKFFVATGFYPPPTRFANHLFDEVLKVAIIPYDAASMGGAIGARLLPGILPVGGIICGGFYEVLEDFASGTDIGTLALEVGNTRTLLAATAASALVATVGASFGEFLVPADDPTEYYKITQADADAGKDRVKATAAIEALTAGKVNIHLLYVMSREFNFAGQVALPLL